jgi:hypothetical protein
MRNALPISLLVLLASCANPYQTARSTVLIGRGAVAMAQTGFDTYVVVETQKCQEQCKQDPVCVDKCMAPVKKAEPVWQKSKLTAVAGLDEADALITVAEKLKQKESIDWLVPLKGAACLLARSLEFLPVETKQKIQSLINMMGSFGCPAK